MARREGEGETIGSFIGRAHMQAEREGEGGRKQVDRPRRTFTRREREREREKGERGDMQERREHNTQLILTSVLPSLN